MEGIQHLIQHYFIHDPNNPSLARVGTESN